MALSTHKKLELAALTKLQQHFAALVIKSKSNAPDGKELRMMDAVKGPVSKANALA
jgi:hypothetical protein